MAQNHGNEWVYYMFSKSGLRLDSVVCLKVPRGNKRHNGFTKSLFLRVKPTQNVIHLSSKKTANWVSDFGRPGAVWVRERRGGWLHLLHPFEKGYTPTRVDASFFFVYINGLLNYGFPPVNSPSWFAIILSSYFVFGSFSRRIPIGPCTTHPHMLQIPRHSGVNSLPLYT